MRFGGGTRVLLGVLVVLGGWGGAHEGAPVQEMPSSAELGERFAAIFNEGDPAIADAIFAPDFVAYVSGSPTPTLDREGWKGYLGSFRASFPDLRLEVEDTVATDDMVILRVVLRGTQTGAFGDLPPSGKSVAFGGIAMHRVENGRIVEHWGVMDLLSLMQQLTAAEVGDAYRHHYSYGVDHNLVAR